MDERSPGSPTLVVSKSVDRGDDSKECRGVSFSETGTLPRKHHQMNIAINTQRLSTRTNSTRASLSSCVDNAPPPPSPQVTVTPRRVKNLVRNIVASPGRKKRDEGDGSGSPSRARPLNGSRVIRAKSFASANRQHDARAAGGSLQRQGSQSPDRQALPSHITSASIEHAIAASQAGTTLSDAPHTAWPSNDGSVPILPLSALSTFRDKPYWGDAGSGGAPPPQQQQQQQGASSSCAFSAHSSENESLLSDEAERPQGSFSSWFLRSDVRLATKVYLALLPAGVSFALVTVLVFVSVGVTELFAVLCCVAAFVGIVTVMLARHLVIATVVSDYDIAERIRPSKEMELSVKRFIPAQILLLLGHNSILEVKHGDRSLISTAVLFSGIRNFDSFAGTATDSSAFDWLVLFTEVMTPILRDRGGVVDKYLGDGIMVLNRNTQPCLVSAMEMQQAIDKLQASARKASKPGHVPDNSEQSSPRQFSSKHALPALFERAKTVRVDGETGESIIVKRPHGSICSRQPLFSLANVVMGISIHSGVVCIGTIGDAQRLDTTVISNVVNLGARFERLTKYYGARILISARAAQAVDMSRYAHRSIGKLVVKGSSEAYELLDVFHTDSYREKRFKQDTKDEFQKALVYYGDRKWERASRAFKFRLPVTFDTDAHEDDMGHKAAETKLYFCKQYATEGVPFPHWSGEDVWPQK